MNNHDSNIPDASYLKTKFENDTQKKKKTNRSATKNNTTKYVNLDFCGIGEK